VRQGVYPTGLERDCSGTEGTSSSNPCKDDSKQRQCTHEVREVILQRRYQYVTMSCVVKTNSAELTQSNFVGQLLRLEVCLDKLKTIAVDRS